MQLREIDVVCLEKEDMVPWARAGFGAMCKLGLLSYRRVAPIGGFKRALTPHVL